MGTERYGIALVASSSGLAAAREVITRGEWTILNVPVSMLLVAIAGTMIGAFLLPSKEAARIHPAPGADFRTRAIYLAFSIGLVALSIVAYAFVGAWAVQAGIGIVKTVFRSVVVHESLVLPVTGIVGVGIRPWLPGLLRAVERRADRVIGGNH